MSSFIGSSKEHDLVLNIGSGSVYGAIVEFQKSAPPKILFTHESRLPLKSNVAADNLISHMLDALHSVVIGLGRQHKKRIRRAHVVLASPWFSSFSKVLSIKEQSPFVVTDKTIEKLAVEHINSVSKDVIASSSSIIEKALSDIRLNGYETKEPYGKSAKTLDVSVYASAAPKETNKKIESKIYQVIHPGSISFHTFPFVAWNVLRSLFAPKDDFIFVNIGGELSDVFIVRRNSIRAFASFPIGRNHLTRKAALHFETQPELASTIVNLYTNDTAETALREKIKTLVNAFGEEWNHGFLRAIKEMEATQDYFLPQRAFFVSTPNTSVIFCDIIGKQIPNVTPLSRENLSQFVGFDSGESPSVPIILEAIYINGHFSEIETVYKQEQTPVK
ncbi:MAG: hypothetical protein AAB635_01965 [Patescibacteria group bacterium]